MTLKEALRRYSNARRRARYWSGIPSFRDGVRSRECRTSRLDEKYELAMCDCKSWEQTIATLTGKPVEHYDPKSEFRNNFSKLLGRLSKTSCDSHVPTA